MKKVIIFLAALAIILGIAGYWIYQKYAINYFKQLELVKNINTKIASMKIGTPRSSILKMLGKPEKIEVYMLGDQAVEFIFFRTKVTPLFGKDTEDSFTPLAIESSKGVMINWGNKFYLEVSSRK